MPNNIKEEASLTPYKPYFCVDCTHHIFDKIEQRNGYSYLHYCKKPALLNVVTGEANDCLSNRLNATLCGREAKYFKDKKETKLKAVS